MAVTQVALIAALAAALSWPWLIGGVADGYDASTHVRYQHHFSKQFWNGEWYPRWLVEENKGLGSPVFLIQYPLPYVGTALLRPMLSYPDDVNREAREIGVFIATILALAGMAAWSWMKSFAAPPAATAAALLYMSLPYMLIDMYANVALGEMCAFVFMPLALRFCDTARKATSQVFLLGASIAMLLVSNVLIALIFAPFLIAYALAPFAESDANLATRIVRLATAAVLGVGMASIYLFPILAHRQLFDLAAMAKNLPGFELGQYFIYMTRGSLGSFRTTIAILLVITLISFAGFSISAGTERRSLRLCAALALALGAATLIPDLGPAITARSGFAAPSSPKWELYSSRLLLTSLATFALGVIAYRCITCAHRARMFVLLVVASVSFFMMLPFSAPLWKAIPALETIQFPFRFNAPLLVAVSGLVALALDQNFQDRAIGRFNRTLGAFGVPVLFVVGIGIFIFGIDGKFYHPGKPIPYDVTTDLDAMYRTYIAPEYVREFAKVTGTSPDSYNAISVPGEGTLKSSTLGNEACVKLTPERPRSLLVSSDCTHATRLSVGQLHFPLWKRVPLGGTSQNTTIETAVDGTIELPIDAGRQEMRLLFDLGASETWGLAVSVASLVFSIFGYLFVFNKETTS